MSQHAHSDAHAHEDHGGIAKYIYVFLALCVLTGASFFTYSSAWPFHNEPKIGWAFMMAVSCTKAMLVVLFFMHVKYEANWKYVLTIPAAFMSIFLILALVPDVGLRGHWVSEERQAFMAEPRGRTKSSLRHNTSHGSNAGEHTAPAEKH
jgi:cytochrome c oxidase subunit 4